MGKLGLNTLLEILGTRTAILDTNLLILRVSALTDPRLLSTFKRLNQFTFEDALLLERLLQRFSAIVTSAYVLAEASNLGNSLFGETRDLWFTQLAAYAQLTEERHVPTATLGARIETIRFGITDSALGVLADSHVVVTTERPLSGYLQSKNKNVLNFLDFKNVIQQRT